MWSKWCVSLYAWANYQRHHDGSDSDVDKDSTKDLYAKTDNEDERITLIMLHWLLVSSLLPQFSTPYKHMQ